MFIQVENPYSTDGTLSEDLQHDAFEAGAKAQMVECARATQPLIELTEELLDIMCKLCKRVNPQHRNCTSCPDITDYREVLQKYESLKKLEGE
jgi:hypothetical protein